MAAPSPEQAHDLAVKHRVGLSRYSTGVVRKVVALLNRTERSIVERLARTGNETVAGQRLEQLLSELRAIQRQGSALVAERMNASVAELAGPEAAFAARLIDAAPTTVIADIFSPVPQMPQIVAAVNARPFQGRFLKDWLSGLDESAAARVRDAVRQGFVEGRTTSEIIQTIRGTKAARFTDGLMETTRRGAETMVRTALTHTANVAHQATYEALGVKEWRFVATLDARTSLICAGLHGKVFKVGAGPQPPRHPNCRSTTIPVVEAIEGVEPFEFPSYEAWLRAQPAEVQDDILGPGKAALFRTGRLPIDRFVDNKGKVLSLSQLKARDSAAFADVERAAKAGARAPAFSASDVEALKVYTGSEYTAINRFLRGEDAGSAEVARNVRALDAALGKAALTDDVTVYRGLDRLGAERLASSGLRFDQVIVDPAYLSTSRRLEEAREFAGDNGLLMAITARKGQRGVDVSEVSTMGTAEREILFARGSKLKVVSWDDVSRTLFLIRQDD